MFQVLLEVLTGHRALERDANSGERFLVRRHSVVYHHHLNASLQTFNSMALFVVPQKDLIEVVAASPAGACEASWRKQLDQQLITGDCLCVFIQLWCPACCLQLLHHCCVCRECC